MFDMIETADILTETAATVALLADKKATIAAKRAAALALYEAGADSDLTDWRAVADVLAALIPVAKAAPLPVIAADDGEWCEYTAAQHKGRGTMFHPGRFAMFRFADGELIRVGLTHKVKLDAPDWARAARAAVSFYKARRAKAFCNLVFPMAQHRHYARWYQPANSYDIAMAQTYADGCAVPEIVEARDLTRDVLASPSKANAETLQYREGPRYLSQLVTDACDMGGDWSAGYRAFSHRAYSALHRFDQRADVVAGLDRLIKSIIAPPRPTFKLAEEDDRLLVGDPAALHRIITAPDPVTELAVYREDRRYAARLADLEAAFAEAA